MAETEKTLQIYQFHVLLRGINPSVWRRILMRSESNSADLHNTIQIAFHWSDFHLHAMQCRPWASTRNKSAATFEIKMAQTAQGVFDSRARVGEACNAALCVAAERSG